MRKIVFTLVFCVATFAAYSHDYDCNDYIEVSEDRMTGTKTTSAKNMLVVSKDGKVGFAILLIKGSGGTIIASITASGGSTSCLNDDAGIIILFRDGSRINMTNDGDFNCNGRYTQYFGGGFGKRDQLRQLQEKEIEAIRVNMRSGFVQQDFTEENSKVFMRTLNCLID